MRITIGNLYKYRFFQVLKMYKFFCLFSAFLFLSSFSLSADDSEVRKEVLSNFQKLLEIKLKQGDKEAQSLAEKARKNGGDLKLELAEIKKIMLKWDPASKDLLNKLATKADKAAKVKEEFEELLKKKVSEEDPQAIRIAEKGEMNGGKLELSVRQMKELISKWEK